MFQGTWKLLDKDKIVVIDRDSSPERLIVSVMNINGGYLETTDNPGVPLETFSVAQMNNGFIGYRHMANETGNFSFSIQVSIIKHNVYKLSTFY